MSNPAEIMCDESVFEGGTIIVKLGKAQREVHVHRRLLRFRSPYFDSILTKRDVKTSAITLFDVEANTFYSFLSWLYADCFIPPRDNQWLGLCKLWLLAERFQVPALQNKVVEVFGCRLYQREVDGLDLEIFHYVYDNTGPGSYLRKLFAYIATSYGNHDVFAQMKNDLPPVFHTDYAAQQAHRAQNWEEQTTIVSWDLTKFLVPEVAVTKGKGLVAVEVETENDCRIGEKHDSPVEERETKRKRTSGY